MDCAMTPHPDRKVSANGVFWMKWREGHLSRATLATRRFLAMIPCTRRGLASARFRDGYDGSRRSPGYRGERTRVPGVMSVRPMQPAASRMSLDLNSVRISAAQGLDPQYRDVLMHGSKPACFMIGERASYRPPPPKKPLASRSKYARMLGSGSAPITIAPG